jgi:hypothetical protein
MILGTTQQVAPEQLSALIAIRTGRTTTRLDH